MGMVNARTCLGARSPCSSMTADPTSFHFSWYSTPLRPALYTAPEASPFRKLG